MDLARDRGAEAATEGNLLMTSWARKHGVHATISAIREGVLLAAFRRSKQFPYPPNPIIVGPKTADRLLNMRVAARGATGVRVIVLVTWGRTRVEIVLDTARPHVVVHRWER
jgi:hypothetical protein